MRVKLAMCWALLIVSFLAKAQNDITIGVIQYDIENIDQSFKELKNSGFGSCQLNYSSKMDEKFAEQVKEAASKNGIKVSTVVGVPGHSVWNFKEGPSTIGLVPKTGREEKIKVYKNMIDFCELAGVPAMHSHFGFIPENPSSEQYIDFISVMKPLAVYAKEKGVMIYFETGQETPTTLIRAIKDIGTGNVFINCDFANLLMYGKGNALDAVKQFGSLIKEVHAKDGKYPVASNPDKLGAEVNIPDGDVDFPAVIEELKKQKFNGAITIECELNGDHKGYVLKTRQYLQDLLNK